MALEVNPVTAAPRTEATARSTADRMSSGDFFKLLIAELRQQDPLEPTKTGDMIGQVSQIRSIELSQQLTSTLQQLTHQQRTTGASELLGKYVEATATNSDGEPSTVSGVVTGVRFGHDGVMLLELDSGQVVRAADVTRIAATEPAQASAADGGAQQTAPTKQEASARPQNQGVPKWRQRLDRSLHL